MLNIKITPATEKKEKPDSSHLGFGIYYTDNMFIIDHTAVSYTHLTLPTILLV